MKRTTAFYLQRLLATTLGGLTHSEPGKERTEGPSAREGVKNSYQSLVLGGGCFWCLEAVFKRVEGVHSVVSGYAGGSEPNPRYETVSSGHTGHAEVIKINFAPRIISLEEILDLFWRAHDPTSLNRQGADVGTQYRSIILYNDEAQEKAARASRQRLEASGRYGKPVVTEIQPLESFYEAEEYHQNYYETHPRAAYCRALIRPKLEKLGLNIQTLPLGKP